MSLEATCIYRIQSGTVLMIAQQDCEMGKDRLREQSAH